jgi:signal transduction histidine kinase
LVGIALQFDAMALSIESLSPSARRHFVRMRKQLEEHISEARQAIYTLRSSSNERRELVAALAEIGKRSTSERSVILSLNVSGEPRRFSPRVKAELLRIAQEAINNAVRHANAAHLIVNVRYGDTSIAVEIVDDGRGFDVNAATDASTHYGLTSMRERAEDVGGVLEITSGPGRGTHVRAVVPLIRSRDGVHAHVQRPAARSLNGNHMTGVQ